MHAIIVALGSHGDVLPLLAIGAELKTRGHAVTAIAPAPFASFATQAGLDFEPLGDELDFETVAGAAKLWRPIAGARRLFEIAALAARPTAEAVLRRRESGRTIIVASTLAFGARIAQEVSRTPMVSVHLSPMVMQSREDVPRPPAFALTRFLPPDAQWSFQLGVDQYFIGPAALPTLNAYRAELGLAPVNRLRHWWHARRRVLLMFPDWFAEPQPDWPAQSLQLGFPFAGRRFDFALDARLEEFLAAGEPPVAVAFSTALREGARLASASVAAARRIGRRVVVAGRFDGAKTDDDVLAVGHTPFHRLFPRCAAVIHHGGVGTTAEALAAGLPQLLVPITFDHFDNAERVRRLGCGEVIGRLAFRAGGGAKALSRLLTAPPRAALGSAAERCRQADALTEAADEVERVYESVRAERRARKERALTAGASPGSL